MVHNRLADLLAAYGSHIENWPKHDQMLFLERTDDIQITEKFIEAQRLDQQLDSFAVSSNPSLKALITSKIKLRLVDRFYQWLVPNSWKLAWQPAIAAMLVVLLGFSIGIQVEQPSPLVSNWEDQLYWAGFAPEDDSYE